MKKNFLTILGIIAICVIVFTTDLKRYITYYTSNIERFESGDKLYLKQEYLNKDAGIITYRAVRPMTIDEYETRHYLFSKEDADAKYKKIIFKDDFFLVYSHQNIDK